MQNGRIGLPMHPGGQMGRSEPGGDLCRNRWIHVGVQFDQHIATQQPGRKVRPKHLQLAPLAIAQYQLQ